MVKKLQKTFALLLTMSMLLSMLSVTTFAAETEETVILVDDEITLTEKNGNWEEDTDADEAEAASGAVWTSSDEAVATVDEGVVTGVSEGTALITRTEYRYLWTGMDEDGEAAHSYYELDDPEADGLRLVARTMTWNVTVERREAAQIGEDTYESLADAIRAAEDGETIQLLKNVRENIRLDKTTGKHITLDLNGKTLTAAAAGSVVTIDTTGMDENQVITIMNGRITGGSATNGGGINITGKVSIYVQLEKLEIVENTSTNRGGVYNTSAKLTLKDGCRVEENTASNSGGGIYMPTNGSVNTSCELMESFVNDNTATAGGGIALGAANYETKGITAAFTMTSGEISGNTAKNGGGVYLVGNGSRFSMEGGTISENETTVNSTQFGNGGGIFSANWYGLQINGGRIVNNTAAQHGGAVYINNVNQAKNPDESLTVASGVEISGNSAAGNGGGIMASTYVKVEVAEGTILYNNTAKTLGDDVYTGSGCTLTLPEVAAMSGDKILDSDGKDITGWYYDGYENSSTRHRWAAKYQNIVLDYDETGKIIGYHKEDGEYYKEYAAPSVTFSGTIALKAAHDKYCAITYVVSGDVPEDYDVPESGEVLRGGSYTVKGVPGSQTGELNGVPGTYVFAGWTLEGETVTALEDIQTDVELAGVWTFQAKPSYSITYTVTGDVPAGYTKPDGTTVYEGGSCSVADVPADQRGEKDGVSGTYVFEGWTLENETVNGTLENIQSNVELTGVWTFTADPVPPKYTVSYAVSGDVPDGYTVPGSAQVTEGEDYSVASVPGSQSGRLNGVSGTFTFEGWMLDGEIVTVVENVQEDVELTGVWSFERSSRPSRDDDDDDDEPSRPVVIPDPETPTTDIPEEDVPLTDGPEEETPLAELPEEEVPMAEVPKTGDMSALWLTLTGLSGSGLVATAILSRKKREEEV